MDNFDPRDVASLRAWYDAMTYSTITMSGSEVVKWADKSGYGNHQIGTAGTAPAFSATALNSLPGVNFASGKFTSAPDHASLDFTQFTAFVVFQRNTDTAGNQGVLCKQTAGGGSNREFSIHVSSSDQNSLQTTTDGTSGTGTTISPGANTVGTPYIFTGYYNGSNLFGKTNDVIEIISSSVASVFNGSGTLDMGRAFGASGVCTISEVLFYVTDLSRTNKRLIERYLAKKWNLSLLGG